MQKTEVAHVELLEEVAKLMNADLFFKDALPGFLTGSSREAIQLSCPVSSCCFCRNKYLHQYVKVKFPSTLNDDYLL